MSIPLQKLPYLAQKEVLSTMKLKEIFKLASLSKKNARIVKACLNDQRFILTVCSTDDSWHIESESSDDIHEYSSEKCRGVFLDKTVYEVLEFIVKVFNKPKICVDFAEDIGKFHNYSRFFESLGLKIDKVSVDRCKQGELQNMLEAFKEVPDVNIFSCEWEKRIQFNKTISYHLESIDIRISGNIGLKWRRDLLFSLMDSKISKLFWNDGSKGQRSSIFGQQFLICPSFLPYLSHFDRKLEIRGRICFMIQQKNNGPKAIVLKEQDSVQLETQFELT
uniref:F-box domain-containing protein n=1 Tax=Caenorhabditis tropicalis TaxID=1561998 RepID=A0A1I7TBH2_9PELO